MSSPFIKRREKNTLFSGLLAPTSRDEEDMGVFKMFSKLIN
jgi:hypothetical protein